MMKRLSLTFGSFLLILGLAGYQFGLLITLHQTVFVNYIINVLPGIRSIELIGALLQLLGATFIVAGFISSVSSIVSIKLEKERRNLMAEILSTLEERIGNIITRQMLTVPQVSQKTRSCKFCGAGLMEGDIFCAACGKSQK